MKYLFHPHMPLMGDAYTCRMNIGKVFVGVFKRLKIKWKIYMNHYYLFQCSFFFSLEHMCLNLLIHQLFS